MQERPSLDKAWKINPLVIKQIEKAVHDLLLETHITLSGRDKTYRYVANAIAYMQISGTLSKIAGVLAADALLQCWLTEGRELNAKSTRRKTAPRSRRKVSKR